MQNSKRLCALFTKRFTTHRMLFARTFVSTAPTRHTTKVSNFLATTNKLLNLKTSPLRRLYHDDAFTDSEEDDTIFQEQPKSVKNALYPNCDDPLLPFLNGCASIQEVFNFLKKYDKIIQPMHLAQAVLVIWDLQMIFQHVTEMTSIDKVEKLMTDYSQELQSRQEFQVFLKLLDQNVNGFDTNELGCMYIYLHKIGVMRKADVMKNLFAKLCEHIPNEEKLPALSKFMVCVCYNNRDETGYNLSKDKLGTILDKLDGCTNCEDLKYISICLNVLNKSITSSMLAKYVHKVTDMLSNDSLTSEHADVLIKIILFLNYPQWRHKHSELLSKCINLLRPKINQLSLGELLILNEVFLKMQEPANILFELQRQTAKLMRELEENGSTAYQKRIRLINSLIQLSAPIQRPGSEEIVRKYILYPLNGKCLLELLKSLQYIKIMDPKFCREFWDKILIELEHDEEFKKAYMLKICYLYMTYNQSLPYRHAKLEKRLNQWIEGLIETSSLLEVPKNFIAAASFVIPYGNDVSIMNFMANMYRDNWEKFGATDCASMARGLQIARILTKNIHLKNRYFNVFSDVSDKIISNILHQHYENLESGQEVAQQQEVDVNIINVLLKSYIYKNKLDHPLVNKLLLAYKEDTYLSSKQIKNLTLCLLFTSALIPGIIDRMVEYVCRCKESILAFNAEKVAYLCYYLGYVPRQSEMFSKILVDLILRDQEKINGLSYLQSCLSLCFFNNMTGPLIKQIFNVRFMEKLDLELKNCYAKDIYPNRVHRRLMELNRTVCIDYPELNIPWFHQKFVDQSKNAELQDPNFMTNVESYLSKIFYDCDIEMNASTPYGYNIDFTIQYKDDDDKMINLAILLTKPKQYTNINTQLKGPVQTKIRHIEMLGYKVKVISFSDWNALVYAEDKITYIRNLLNLPSKYPRFYYQINR